MLQTVIVINNFALQVFFAVMMGSMALGQAGPQFAVVGTAQGAAGAILDIIDRVILYRHYLYIYCALFQKPEIDSYDASGKQPKDIKGGIEFKNIHFSYPTRSEVKVIDYIYQILNRLYSI